MSQRSLKTSELPYHPDSSQLFARVAQHPWAVFLDSTSMHHGAAGRYDIIAADPFITVEYSNQETCIKSAQGEQTVHGNPFIHLRVQLGKLSNGKSPYYNHFPFCGGAIGYFSYDLARCLETLPVQTCDDLHLPDLACGIYDWAIVVDHQLRKTHLISAGRDPATETNWSKLVEKFSSAHDDTAKGTDRSSLAFDIAGSWQSNMDEDFYHNAFRQIQNYIRAGDCYQVNFSQRFQLPVEGDPWHIYLWLRKNNPAPYSAFLRLPETAILSLSPERFLQVRNNQVATQPIKGTRPRSVFPYEDMKLAQMLQESVKDRAENVMIVDLLRNDLSKHCLPGSVHVPELFTLQSFASVHHLVSTIRGTLLPESNAIDLLQACFPGGSITGAPKYRAMQIIEELEPHRRAIYCGAIGYIGYDGTMDTNIAIRTLVHCAKKLYCWAGGGIVYDSEVQTEFQECFDKIKKILQLSEKKDVRH